DVTTAKIATLTTDKAVAVDDGKAAITFTATVKDAGGAVVPNVEVKFATTEGALSKTEATTDEHGVATVTLTSRVAGKVDVSAKTAVDTEGKTTSVNFEGVHIELTSDKQVLLGGATEITAIVQSDSGRLIPNMTVEFKSSAGTIVHNAVTDTNGMVKVQFVAPQITGVVNITATTGSSSKTVDIVVVLAAKMFVWSWRNVGSDCVSDGFVVVPPDKPIELSNVFLKGSCQRMRTELNWAVSGAVQLRHSGDIWANENKVICNNSMSKSGQVILSTDGGEVLSKDIICVGSAETAKIATLEADSAVVKMHDGKGSATFTATVEDVGGSPVPNTMVQFTTTEGALSKTEVITDEHGVATVTLTSRVAGKVDVSAKTAVDTEGKTTSVTFTMNVSVFKLEPDKPNAIADGQDPVTFTATVVNNEGGHPVPNVRVKFTQTKGRLSKTEVTTDEYGVAKVVLTSAVGGWIDVSANVELGTETTVKKASANFLVDINPHDPRSKFYFDPQGILANGKTTSTLWIQVYGTDGSQIKYAEDRLALSVQDMQEQGVAAKTTYSPVNMAQTTYYWSSSLFSGKKAGKIKVSLIYMGKETALNTAL
ncbi:Ig-like domain-containing protein, partial [Yersinia ruckeri]